MASIDVIFDSRTGVRPTGAQRVFTRAKWADDWTEAPELFAQEVVWNTSPALPTATLLFHYGLIAQAGSLEFQAVEPASLNGHYLKIEFDAEVEEVDEEPVQQTLIWCGIIEVDDSEIEGNVSGSQTLTAYGMEVLLLRHTINSMLFQRHSAARLGQAGEVYASGYPRDFNQLGYPNATANNVEGFATRLFAEEIPEAEFWSTRQIVRYLLAHQTPRDKEDEINVPWVLDEATEDNIPAGDRPTVRQFQRSTLGVLNEVLAIERLLGYYVTVDEQEEGPDAVVLHPITMTPDLITAPDGSGFSDIPANEDVVNLQFSRDATAAAAVNDGHLNKYDQVIMTGARRRSVFSVSYADGTLRRGWDPGTKSTSGGDSELQILYNQGASNATGYPADTGEKRKWDAEARSRDVVRDVYAYYVLAQSQPSGSTPSVRNNPRPWLGFVRDGVNGLPDQPVFVNGDTGAPRYWPRSTDDDDRRVEGVGDTEIEQTTPLLAGVDYEGAAVAEGIEEPADAEELPPMAWLLKPADESIESESDRRWHAIEEIGRGSDLPETDREQHPLYSLSVMPSGKGLELRVGGAPQHAIADRNETSPTGGTGGNNIRTHDLPAGDATWRDIIVTCSVADDRLAEGRYPADGDLPEDKDYIRRLVIPAGDEYRQNYIVPETVVGTADEGSQLIRSTGGFLVDDSPKLEALAKLAHTWFSQDRKTLVFETDLINANLRPGRLVGTIDVDSETTKQIRGVITEVRITSYISEGGAPLEPPRIRIVTDSGNLDPVVVPPGTGREPGQELPSRTFPDRAVTAEEGGVPFLDRRTIHGFRPAMLPWVRR